MTGRKASQACLGRSLLYLVRCTGHAEKWPRHSPALLPRQRHHGVFTAAEPWLVPQPGRAAAVWSRPRPAHVTAPCRLFVLPLLQTAWRPPASSQYYLHL